MCTRLPLVVILGATGSGKTKLSLELAQKFGGEIIGSDSMQVYKCLDIVTAKVTKEEKQVAPHHLIDILEPHENFTVVQYRNQALKVIDSLLTQNKLPIVVGGTNYYIESLLWKILIEEPDTSLKNTTPWILENGNDHELSSEVLHKKLEKLDPNMAKRLHPNNKRKILRSLEVLQQKGRQLSEILDEQHSSEGASTTGGPLRYPNSVILWLNCNQETLNDRLDKRVDKMMNDGLVNELLNFHRIFNENRVGFDNNEPDYTKGVFQSIGFKEFHQFLMLPEEDKKSQLGEKKLAQGIEQLKCVTRRYARKQNRWVNNRFLGRTDRLVPPVFALDTTNVDLWDQNITQPAFEIVQSFINNQKCSFDPLPKKCDSNSRANTEDKSYFCEVCDRVFVGEFQWNIHQKSNRHKKATAKKNKLEKMEKNLELDEKFEEAEKIT